MKSKMVSTHSRLKAAELAASLRQVIEAVSTHSRLKAAGQLDDWIKEYTVVSTHSRLKAAERRGYDPKTGVWFQHTAA